jgi:outer membrane protein TolC
LIPPKPFNRFAALMAAWVVVAAPGGCVLAPSGHGQQQRALSVASAPYAKPYAQRQLPDLPDEPSWQQVLQRAFLANGELEAAYHEWAAAVYRIDQDAAWPNASVEVGFSYMFSDQNMKSWDRTALSAGFAGNALALPFKTQQAGKVALANAQAAGQRFLARKFEIQRQVLQAWIDYALMAERVRIARDNVELWRLVVETARGRVGAGGMQQDLLKADVELSRAEDELRSMEAQLPQMQAILNSMLGRTAAAPLAPPRQVPAARAIAADDARLIEVAVARNPQLGELARQVQGREDAVELARMMYIPDISPMAAITGDVSKMLGAMVMLPTNLPAIHSEVRQMRAMLAATEAMLRQATLDRSGQFVAALYALRNYERQAALFEQRIVPASQRVVELSRQSYANGGVAFVELIDSQRMLLEARLALAEARAGRERRLAELEALAGVDIETLVGGPATHPATILSASSSRKTAEPPSRR